MIGESLLHYEIKDTLGKGGMGEVFRARDSKLGRDVAIKILPADFSGDPEREARFQREARALAALQHPNVASVYGFEETAGTRFLVMELVPGSDLTGLIKSGPSPVDEVLPIARQIAAGLEAAHENGIVHRDLKPANIMRTEDGEIKILDFGLAQAWLGETPDAGSSLAPTITAAMTQAGAVLGTAAYMSPEQARGSRVDRRTDIWAFGVILFELLTGKQLFQGETVSDTLAAVLRAEPEWEALPVAEAPGLCHLIERCLVRDPKQRLRDIGEARIFLQDGEASGTHLGLSRLDLGSAGAEPARGGLPLVRTAVLAVACLAIGGLVGWKVLGRPTPPPVLHAMLPPPADTDYGLNPNQPGPAVLSPDGSMVAFTATDTAGTTRLYLRHLDQGDAVAISGAVDAAYPFWSADDADIGFFDMAGGKLRKVAVGGGPPVTVCPAANGKGGSWNADGVIIFAPSHDGPIFRVPAVGGEAVPITKLDPDHDSHRHPRFLPDGRHFIYTARQAGGNNRPNDIFLASLDTTVAPRLIATSQANADYADGYLLTVKEGVLMATPFTPDQEQPPVGGTPLVEDVLSLATGSAVAVFSPSRDGALIYQTGASAAAGQTLFWTDTATGASHALGDPGQLGSPVLSPDETRAVVPVAGESEEGVDLWLVDLATGLRTRFTFAVGDETNPLWSHDGASVFYLSHADSVFAIVRQPVEGQGGGTVLFSTDRVMEPSGVTPDDRALLLNYARDDGNIEMRRLDLAGDGAGGEPTLVAAAPDRNLGGGVASPDGRWIAYHTQTTAGWDVFVMPADGGTRKWQVSNVGCVYPHWIDGGKQLWMSEFDGNLRAYTVDGSGATFRVGAFRRLVKAPVPDVGGCYYDPTPDGRHILETGNDPAFRSEISFLHLVTDWRRGLMH